MSWAGRKPLSHATKSYSVNRPLHGTIFVACDMLTSYDRLRHELRLSQRFKTCFRADLHDTILSHATSSRQAYDMTLRLSQRFKTCFKMLRHFCRRTQQSYIMSWACRKPLSHATKSYRVNRPLKCYDIFSDVHNNRKGRFTRYDFVACDNGLRQAHDMIYDCCVRLQKCRSILKHVLKRCDNRKVMS